MKCYIGAVGALEAMLRFELHYNHSITSYTREKKILGQVPTEIRKSIPSTHIHYKAMGY